MFKVNLTFTLPPLSIGTGFGFPVIGFANPLPDPTAFLPEGLKSCKSIIYNRLEGVNKLNIKDSFHIISLPMTKVWEIIHSIL